MQKTKPSETKTDRKVIENTRKKNMIYIKNNLNYLNNLNITNTFKNNNFQTIIKIMKITKNREK